MSPGRLFLSVIVPLRNGGEFLPALLQSLDRQLLDGSRYEVLLIDNGSTDDSATLIGRFAAERPHVSAHDYDKKISSYAARNHGVRQAAGDILVFTDCDCLLSDSFLLHIIQFYENSDREEIIAGRINIVLADERNPWELFDKMTFLNNYAMSRRNAAATANLSVRRRVFEQVGLFREVTSGGDKEWTARAAQAGFRIAYRDNVLVDHPSRKSAQEIEEKMLRLAYGEGERRRLGGHSFLGHLALQCLKVSNLIRLAALYRHMRRKAGFLPTVRFLGSYIRIRSRQVRRFAAGYREYDAKEGDGE